MAIMQTQQMVTKATDPNNVAETFANGPISIQGVGNVATITFTSIRQSNFDATSKVPTLSAIVVARVALPIDVMNQLKDLLNRSMLEHPPVPHSKQ